MVNFLQSWHVSKIRVVQTRREDAKQSSGQAKKRVFARRSRGAPSRVYQANSFHSRGAGAHESRRKEVLE